MSDPTIDDEGTPDVTGFAAPVVPMAQRGKRRDPLGPTLPAAIPGQIWLGGVPDDSI